MVLADEELALPAREPIHLATTKLSEDHRKSLRVFLDKILAADYSEAEYKRIWVESETYWEIILPSYRALFQYIHACLDSTCDSPPPFPQR